MNENELYHFGVKGMKWGVKRSKNNYRSISIGSALAKRQNAKVDKSFKKWKENSQKRDNAINLGKTRNASKLAYESNKSDKTLKKQFKQDNKAYKKALRQNTTYRKGQVKGEVGSDLSRKYLSNAKKVKKQLDSDPSNKQLKKQYDSYMSKHAVERAKARRAPMVAAKRSNKKAAIKRGMTMTVKAAVGSAAVGAGVYAVNRYLDNHKVTLNGSPVRLKAQNISDVVKYANKVKNILGYF